MGLGLCVLCLSDVLVRSSGRRTLPPAGRAHWNLRTSLRGRSRSVSAESEQIRLKDALEERALVFSLLFAGGRAPKDVETTEDLTTRPAANGTSPGPAVDLTGIRWLPNK